MRVTEDGILMEVNFVQPEKAYWPNDLRVLGNVIVESEAQFWKHLSGIVVIAFGKDDVVTRRVLIDVIVEFRKAHSPNEVNVEGNSTEEVIFPSLNA